MGYIKIQRKYLLQVVWELQGATHMVEKYWSKTLSQGGVEETQSQNAHSEAVKILAYQIIFLLKTEACFCEPQLHSTANVEYLTMHTKGV